MDDEIESLFRQLVHLPPKERAQFCELRGVPLEVRTEVESLLDFDFPEATFDGIVPFQVRDLVEPPVESLTGSQCGPYRLVRLLGSGGAGEVYLAERTDGHITQVVAIKLLGYAGRGGSFRRRFLRERQILAGLQHPGIARLLDVGETGTGKPYLVMDFIDGEHIDAFAARLDLSAKLELFLRVCDAVAYAHRNLVVHRDLKPSNILVDATGNPRLLDFGIARILDDPTDSTRTVERLLTPDYASPEQVQGRRQTTATDIYSLGAVLYDLLTGVSPHAFTERTLEAIDAAICSAQPAAPSKLNAELSQDLDCILLKALRKEPEERYSSVEAMGADVRAMLEFRPVQARSGNAWYRTRKYVRRYRAPVAAVVLTVTGLSAGLFVANRERQLAQRRFQQLHQLSAQMFDLDRDIRKLPGATEARHRLVAASLQYLENLGPSRPNDLDLAQEIGEGYRQVGMIQGVPSFANLGEFGKAEQSLKKGAGFIDMVLTSHPKDPRALLVDAGIAHDRMIIAQSERRDTDASVHAAKAAKSLDRLEAGKAKLSLPQQSELAVVFSNVALFYMNARRYEDAVRYARRSIEAAASLPTKQALEAANLSLIGNSLRCQGHLEEALQALRDALKIAEEYHYPSESDRALKLYSILIREARTLGHPGGVSLNRRDEALVDYQRAVDLTDEAAARDPRDQASRDRLITCAREMADLLSEFDPVRSLAVYELALRRTREVGNNIRARRREAALLADSSFPLRKLHRIAESRQRIAAAFSLMRETKDYPTDHIDPESDLVTVLRAEADHESEAGNRKRAVEVYKHLFAAVMASKPDPLGELTEANKVSMMYYFMARAHRRAGELAKAADLDARRLELWRHWDTKLPGNVYVRRELAMRTDQ